MGFIFGLLFSELLDGKFISRMVNDPNMLRLILEALLVDDLHRKHHTLDLGEVMHQVQNNPHDILKQADDKAKHLNHQGSALDPKADRSTQETEAEDELRDDQLDFFGDGI